MKINSNLIHRCVWFTSQLERHTHTQSITYLVASPHMQAEFKYQLLWEYYSRIWCVFTVSSIIRWGSVCGNLIFVLIFIYPNNSIDFESEASCRGPIPYPTWPIDESIAPPYATDIYSLTTCSQLQQKESERGTEKESKFSIRSNRSATIIMTIGWIFDMAK